MAVSACELTGNALLFSFVLRLVYDEHPQCIFSVADSRPAERRPTEGDHYLTRRTVAENRGKHVTPAEYRVVRARRQEIRTTGNRCESNKLAYILLSFTFKYTITIIFFK